MEATTEANPLPLDACRQGIGQSKRFARLPPHFAGSTLHFPANSKKNFVEEITSYTLMCFINQINRFVVVNRGLKAPEGGGLAHQWRRWPSSTCCRLFSFQYLGSFCCLCVCVCPAVTFRHDPPPRLPEKGKMSPLPPPPPPPPMIYERRHRRRSFSSIQWLLLLFQYFSMKYFSECENGCSHPVSSSSLPPLLPSHSPGQLFSN